MFRKVAACVLSFALEALGDNGLSAIKNAHKSNAISTIVRQNISEKVSSAKVNRKVVNCSSGSKFADFVSFADRGMRKHLWKAIAVNSLISSGATYAVCHHTRNCHSHSDFDFRHLKEIFLEGDSGSYDYDDFRTLPAFSVVRAFSFLEFVRDEEKGKLASMSIRKLAFLFADLSMFIFINQNLKLVKIDERSEFQIMYGLVKESGDGIGNFASKNEGTISVDDFNREIESACDYVELVKKVFDAFTTNLKEDYIRSFARQINSANFDGSMKTCIKENFLLYAEVGLCGDRIEDLHKEIKEVIDSMLKDAKKK